MARRRYQDPRPQRVGNWWYLLYWQDQYENGRRTRKRKRVKLAPATMPKREVEKIAAEHLRPLNQGLLTVTSAMKFSEYVDAVYRQADLKLMAASTQERTESVLKNYLLPAFGESCLRDLTPFPVQKYLAGMADSKLSQESRDKIKDVLSSILGSAVKYGYLIKNPVQGLRLPKSKLGTRSKPYITPDMFLGLISLVREPYATMVYVALQSGLRASELIGLRWRNVHADSITINERYARGDWGPPKSAASNATIAVSKATIDRILRLKTLVVEVKAGRAIRRFPAVKSGGPDDLVFQSVAKGRPMRDNNILTRHIKPAARALGIPFVNWQVLRRSYATWLKMAGADVKDAQAQMRHSRASTTLDIYQQFVPESQRRAVDKMAALAGSGMVN